MAELANCSRCDRVFAKSMRDICQNCYQEEEKAFEIVYKFLRQQKNREATLTEIVEATEVEEELIIKFIREKRLRTSQFPKLAYPCEECGADITTGKLCTDCSHEILKRFLQEEKIAERKKEQKEEVPVYYSYGKHKR